MSFVAPARWTARVLSGLIALFFGFFLIAHLFGNQGRPSRPLMWNDYAILITIVISIVGLLLAWKWEFAGAAITLVAIALCAAVNWNVLVFPGALIPFTAILYLFSCWIRMRASRSSGNPYVPIR